MTPSENAGTHQKAKGKENRGMCPLSGQKLASLCLGALSACWNCQWNSHRCRWVCVKTYWSFWSRLSLWWQIMATQLSNTSSLLAERTGAIFSFSGWTKSLMWLIWIGKEGGKKTSAQEWVRVPWIALQPGPWVCHARCLWGARCRRRWWCTGGGGGGARRGARPRRWLGPTALGAGRGDVAICRGPRGSRRLAIVAGRGDPRGSLSLRHDTLQKTRPHSTLAVSVSQPHSCPKIPV